MSHWHRSCVEESQLEDFAVKGFLPPKEEVGWRAPPPENEGVLLWQGLAGEGGGAYCVDRRFRASEEASPCRCLPGVHPLESNKGWHGDWFYIKNLTEASFPKFKGKRPAKDTSWSWGTPTPEKALVKALEGIIWNHVVKEGLNGMRLFHTMRERRVTPLAKRKRLMWLYFGPSDPDRLFAEELPEDEVWSWLLMDLKGAD
ncbi:hypothetical protein C2845_PM11G04950 [Panicum miliaceum]|uniref:Uncharacterized protein n=1 Tax=Panicum miliaceum TaxID=4540 RepID=A0A3L6RQD9_PANMI|nr:hypothetical protein C2845_PM11G04950 [Panicum miliaceum]